MIVFAHAGHWALQLLYAAPVVVMLVLLVVGKIRHSRETAQKGEEPPADYT